jgi:hypothetical protein
MGANLDPLGQRELTGGVHDVPVAGMFAGGTIDAVDDTHHRLVVTCSTSS